MAVTRRDALKVSGLAVGGLALGGGLAESLASTKGSCPTVGNASKNSYFNSLEPCHPWEETLAAGEMRITFLGTSCIPRIAQACNSVFVELGNGTSTPADTFVFDCGTGVAAKYSAMNIPFSRIDKIFLSHLHGDHTSDLTHIYCFGPANDRKTPMYVWGPSRSGLPRDPNDLTSQPYEDGTIDYCGRLRELARWHTEAFSFLPTGLAKTYPWTPPWWDPDKHVDGYDLVPFELPWQSNPGIAYKDKDGDPNVTVTHFPAFHDRQGSISYKLKWKIGKENGKDVFLSMIFTGDTKPNYYLVDQAKEGVDVLIHEMVVPPEVWAAKNSGMCPPPDYAVNTAEAVENNSHTPQKAYGYILSLLATPPNIPPRLAVGTHFQATDDTIKAALHDIRLWYPESKGEVQVADDLLVLNVTKSGIRKRRGVVSDYTWYPPIPPTKAYAAEDLGTPKYCTPEGAPDPYAQLVKDWSAHVIDPDLYNAR
jgi:ribonuclease Z